MEGVSALDTTPSALWNTMGNRDRRGVCSRHDTKPHYGTQWEIEIEGVSALDTTPSALWNTMGNRDRRGGCSRHDTIRTMEHNRKYCRKIVIQQVLHYYVNYFKNVLKGLVLRTSEFHL